MKDVQTQLIDMQDGLYKINAELSFLSLALCAWNGEVGDMRDNERQGFSLIIDGIVKEINELSSAT